MYQHNKYKWRSNAVISVKVTSKDINQSSTMKGMKARLWAV